MEQKFLYKKIENIENELHKLKTIILSKPKKTLVSLKGILKEIKIDEKDIQEAKKSLFH